MDKAKRHEQRTTAQDSCGDGERPCRPWRSALAAPNSQQQERHHQARILKPLPTGKEKIRTAKDRAIVDSAGICMTCGQEDDRTQQPPQPRPQANQPPLPAVDEREREHGDGRVSGHQRMQKRGQTEPQDRFCPFLVEHGCQREETERRGKGTRRNVGIHDGERCACNR